MRVRGDAEGVKKSTSSLEVPRAAIGVGVGVHRSGYGGSGLYLYLYIRGCSEKSKKMGVGGAYLEMGACWHWLFIVSGRLRIQ